MPIINEIQMNTPADVWRVVVDDTIAPTATPPKTPEQAAHAWATMDYIDAHPKTHDQGWWFTPTECGTVACFAGWASLLAGDRPVPMSGSLVYTDDTWQMEHVRGRAQELLGLTLEEACRLFAGGNTRADLRAHLAEIYGPRPVADPAPVDTQARVEVFA